MTFKEIETEQELDMVLNFCYQILGEDNSDLYGYLAWKERFLNGLQPMVYVQDNDKVISAILGRAENADSMIIGFVACDEGYRRQGITKKLMEYFERLTSITFFN